MKTLNVNVADKIATYQTRDGVIICGNSDYQIQFAFDEEWNGHDRKTARFEWNGQYHDVEFTGNVCQVPVIRNTSKVYVGVYVGETPEDTLILSTTRCEIPCGLSVRCGGAKADDGTGENYTNEAKGAAAEAKAAAEDAREYAEKSKARDYADIETHQAYYDAIKLCKPSDVFIVPEYVLESDSINNCSEMENKTSIVFPNGFRGFTYWDAASYASQITEITHLPLSCTILGSTCFTGFPLELIKIPRKVTEIYGSFLEYITSDHVIIDFTAFEAGEAFPTLQDEYITDSSMTIKVRRGRKAELASMTNWSAHADRIFEVEV